MITFPIGEAGSKHEPPELYATRGAAATWAATAPRRMAAAARRAARPRRAYRLVSRKPPLRWEDAMIGGNGTTGIMVMGLPLEELIVVNHAKLWVVATTSGPNHPTWPIHGQSARESPGKAVTATPMSTSPCKSSGSNGTRTATAGGTIVPTRFPPARYDRRQRPYARLSPRDKSGQRRDDRPLDRQPRRLDAAAVRLANTMSSSVELAGAGRLPLHATLRLTEAPG